MLVKGYKLRYKINNFWGCNIQLGGYSELSCLIWLKVLKRVGLKCYHHQKEKR